MSINRAALVVVVAMGMVMVGAQYREQEPEWRCPQYWLQHDHSCYRFIKSPLRSRNDARRNCQAYEADLVSVSSKEEHSWLMLQLLWQDPQHRRWYIGAHQQSAGYWVNDGDGTSLSDLDASFHPEPSFDTNKNQPKDYLIYSFSNQLKRWGLERVSGEEILLYICEAPVSKMHSLIMDDRTYQYGIDVDNPDRIPLGPFFIKQPVNFIYDLSLRKTSTNDVSLSCLAGGFPTPTYEWFKEDYENDRLIAQKINPLSNPRYTISGGTLIINNPDQLNDRGSYHCKVTNEFGTIVSESVTLAFGFIGEFNLKRSAEIGNENWGKAIFCDPPQHFPDVMYYWARDYFPNFVEQDKRVFVSYDGALYFSALETIDIGNYSCTVNNRVSNTGRNGPFFPLRVSPHSNYQQLKFPNNFPKAFPDAPVAGSEVRLECMAFGYPVPSYNWTRRGSSLPRGYVAESYNRVLRLPNVQVEDQGEYVCRVYNDRASIEHSVMLSIQAEPNFTIPLMDKHMDNKADLTWMCEAFGIPDVSYSWYRNGELLEQERLPPADRDRYVIQDNVLSIRYLDPERDPAMYQCRATNVLKTKYSSAQLRVLSLKPSFKKKPLEPETYAAENGNVTIHCSPEAAPRPKFVWKKDGIVIGGGGRRRILENGNLIISPVSRDDQGMYSCHAQNDYGSDESQGRLIVLRGPSLYEQLQPRITMSVREDRTLRCQASSEDYLDLAYIWTHNGLRIVNMEHLNYPKLKVDGGTLYVQNATFAEAGDYECIVKSAVGRVVSRTTLTVEGPPGPPGGVQVGDVTKTSATIQWTDGANNGRPIFYYTISARTKWNSTWFNVSRNATANDIDRYNGRKSASLENVLSPWLSYEFRVQAGNFLGLGLPSAPSPQYSTPPDRPYTVPSGIGGGGGKIGDLIIAWKTLPPQEQNGPGIYYRVFWRRHRDTNTEFQKLDLKEFGNVGITVVRIQTEYYYTKYDVKVQAANNIGYGPESAIQVIYSAEDMPQVAPQQVSARAFNSTCVNVSWVPIDQTRERVRGRLIGHRLKYWKNENREEDSVYYLSRTTRPWALVVGLQPNTYYYVKVMAYNSAGEGPESERFLEKTFRKAPQKPPSAVHVSGVNPSTVRVVWRYVAPSLEEEPLIGYKIRVWEVDQDMSTANDTVILVGSILEAYVTNLSPGKVYHMRVLAFSNGGDGRMSSPAHTFQMGDAAVFRSGSGQKSPAYLAVVLAFLLLLVTFEIA